MEKENSSSLIEKIIQYFKKLSSEEKFFLTDRLIDLSIESLSELALIERESNLAFLSEWEYKSKSKQVYKNEFKNEI